MRPRPFLLLIALMATLFLVVFGAKDVEGEHTFGQIPIQTFNPGYSGNSMDVSADGKYVVAGTSTGITLYDRELESQIWNYGTDAKAVSISSNGDYIAGGNEDEIYLFGRASSTPLWSYEFSYDYGLDSVMSLEFTDNGEKLILSSSYNISLFDVSDGDLIWYCYGFNCGMFDFAPMYSYDVSADGQYVAVCSGVGDTIVYDSRFVGNDNYSFSYNSIGDCNSIAISPDGQDIVTVSTQQLSELVEHPEFPEENISRREDTAHLNFYSRDNNNTIKTTELDKEIYLEETWGTYEGFCDKSYYYGHNPTCYESDIVFSEDGNHIALAFNKMYGEEEYEEECDEDWNCTGYWNWPNASASLHHFEKNILDSDGPYVEVWNSLEYYSRNCAYPKVDLSDDGQNIVYSCGNARGYGSLLFFDDGNARPRWSVGYQTTEEDFDDEKQIGRWNAGSISSNGEFVAIIERYYGGLRIYDNSLPKPDLEISCCSDNLDISNEEPLGGDNITLSVNIWMYDCCHRALDSHFIVSFYYSDYDYLENSYPDYDYLENSYLIGNVTIDKWMETPMSVVWTNVPVGTFNIYVVADSTNLIDEQSEGNNVLASEWGSEYPEFIGYGGLAIWERPIAIAGNDVTVDRGETVQFAGMGSADDRLNIVKYQWDFDADGLYEYESSVDGITTFIYNEEGKHTAIFKITDDGGFEATDSRIITVKATDYQEKEKCVDGDTKIAEDGCNQCICNNEEWVCTEVDCNPDDSDDDGFLPAPSLAASVAAVAVIALRRRRGD